MDNLKFPKKEILLSEIGADQLIVKQIDGVTTIILKDQGIMVPVPSGSKYSVAHTDNGTNQGVALKLSNAAPVNITNYEFGVSVRKKFRMDTDRQKFTHGRMDTRIYSDVIPVLSVTGAVIDDSSLLEIESNLLAQVLDDATRNVDAAFLECRRAYIVKDAVNTDASGFNVNLADGTTYTYATTDAGALDFRAGELASQFNANANVNTNLMALRMSGDYALIISKDSGYDFTIDTLVDTTIISHELVFSSNDPEIQFDIFSASNSRFAVQRDFFLASINCASINPSQISVNINGVKKTLITATSQANVLSAINGFGTIYGTSISSVIYVTSAYPHTLTQLHIRLNTTSVALFGSWNIVGRGSYPMHTADHIFKKFAAKNGQYEGMVRTSNTIANTDYTVVSMVSVSKEPTTGDQASSYVDVKTRIAIIFPKSYCNDALWDAESGTDGYFTTGTTNTIVQIFTDIFGSNKFDAS